MQKVLTVKARFHIIISFRLNLSVSHMPPMYLQHCCRQCLQYCYDRRTSAAGSKKHCRSLPPVYQWCLALVNFTSILGGKIGMVLLLVTSALVSQQVVQLYLVAYENQSLHTHTYFALIFCLFVFAKSMARRRNRFCASIKHCWWGHCIMYMYT